LGGAAEEENRRKNRTCVPSNRHRDVVYKRSGAKWLDENFQIFHKERKKEQKRKKESGEACGNCRY
jgi:hypothetical protein